MTKLYGNLNNQTKLIRKLYARDSQGKSKEIDYLYAQNDEGLSTLIYDFPLPEGYTKVKCLISDGASYIDTGIVSIGSIRAKLDFEWVELPTSKAIVSGINYGGAVEYIIGADANNWIAGYSSSITLTTAPYPVLNKRYNVYTRYVIDYEGQTIHIDGVRYFKGSKFTQYSFGTVFYLFCNNSSYGPSDFVKIKLYSIKYYKGSLDYCDEGVLIRDFVPCIRDSDNEPGLYDRVNDVFYSNQGSGTFTVEEQ